MDGGIIDVLFTSTTTLTGDFVSHGVPLAAPITAQRIFDTSFLT